MSRLGLGTFKTGSHFGFLPKASVSKILAETPGRVLESSEHTASLSLITGRVDKGLGIGYYVEYRAERIADDRLKYAMLFLSIWL